jgi:hypothetical protein
MKPSMSAFALAVLLLVLVQPSSVLGAGQAVVEFDSHKGTITVETAGVAIEEVLSDISQKTGIRVFIDPEIHKNVTVSLKAVPLETALHQIARGLSYALFFESGRGRQRLAGIRIVSQGKPGPEPPRRVTPSPSYDMGGRTGGEDTVSPDEPAEERKPVRPLRPTLFDTPHNNTLGSPDNSAPGINDVEPDPEPPVMTGPMRHRRTVPMGTDADDANDISGAGSDGGPSDEAVEDSGDTSEDGTTPGDTDQPVSDGFEDNGLGVGSAGTANP